jgi:ATP phosphoribosyltransferase regulatory subunit HisZ
LYERVMGSPTYAQTTEKYTRSKEVHDGLDTRFILSATWLSPEWARAFSEEFASIYYLDAERVEKVTSQWKSESENHVRFFVALFVPEEKGNDLEKSDTLWSLRLVRADEKDFAPAYIRKSDLKPAEISRFFPYSGTWYRAYEVAFPKEAYSAEAVKPGTSRLKFVLTGVQGRAVLAWE